MVRLVGWRAGRKENSQAKLVLPWEADSSFVLQWSTLIHVLPLPLLSASAVMKMGDWVIVDEGSEAQMGDQLAVASHRSHAGFWKQRPTNQVLVSRNLLINVHLGNHSSLGGIMMDPFQ